MKKMQLFKRISAMAMVFAMVGVTSAFAATGATEHESGHITESAGVNRMIFTPFCMKILRIVIVHRLGQ